MDEVVAIHAEPPQRVAGTLANLGMPSHEIASVLAAAEPLVLGGYFELHRERLKEALADQLQALAEIERVLALAILRQGVRSAGGDVRRVGTRTVWIVVCEDFHGATGPLPTEALAREAAEVLSADGPCTDRPVQLLLVREDPLGRRRSRAMDATKHLRPARLGACLPVTPRWASIRRRRRPFP